MSDTQLVRYDAMCHAIAACLAVDEAKDIRDKAVAIETYARQAKNFEAERQAAEIRKRAERKCGELIPQQIQQGGDHRSKSADATLKLADLGITRDQSSEWQQLAKVPPDTFERAMAEPSIAGMRRAIQEAVDEAHGGPPPARQRREADPVGDDWIDLTAPIKHIAGLMPDLAALARYVPQSNPRCLEEASMARELIRDWIDALKREEANGSRAAQSVTLLYRASEAASKDDQS
jgi:hypothetical protein